eukprot:2166926-Prymnesium_polylepis.1
MPSAASTCSTNHHLRQRRARARLNAHGSASCADRLHGRQLRVQPERALDRGDFSDEGHSAGLRSRCVGKITTTEGASRRRWSTPRWGFGRLKAPREVRFTEQQSVRRVCRKFGTAFSSYHELVRSRPRSWRKRQ